MHELVVPTCHLRKEVQEFIDMRNWHVLHSDNVGFPTGNTQQRNMVINPNSLIQVVIWNTCSLNLLHR